MPGTYDELRQDLQSELDEPGPVTRDEVQSLLDKHPSSPPPPVDPPSVDPTPAPPVEPPSEPPSSDGFFDPEFSDPSYFE